MASDAGVAADVSGPNRTSAPARAASAAQPTSDTKIRRTYLSRHGRRVTDPTARSRPSTSSGPSRLRRTGSSRGVSEYLTWVICRVLDVRAAGSAHETACVEWRSDEPGPTGPGTRAPQRAPDASARGSGGTAAGVYRATRDVPRAARPGTARPRRRRRHRIEIDDRDRRRPVVVPTGRDGAWRSHLRSHVRERVVRREGRSEAGSVMPADRVPGGQEPACRQWRPGRPAAGRRRQLIDSRGDGVDGPGVFGLRCGRGAQSGRRRARVLARTRTLVTAAAAAASSASGTGASDSPHRPGTASGTPAGAAVPSVPACMPPSGRGSAGTRRRFRWEGRRFRPG